MKKLILGLAASLLLVGGVVAQDRYRPQEHRECYYVRASHGRVVRECRTFRNYGEWMKFYNHRRHKPKFVFDFQIRP